MDLDIVMPAYNEEHRIGRTLAAYRDVIADPDVGFWVALDDPEDATPDVVEAHRAEDPRVRPLRYPKLGKGGVIIETLWHCRAEHVAVVDADGATPPAELLRLAAAARAADGAIASRRHPAAVLPARRTLLRRGMSAGFSVGVRRLFGLPYLDTQCGAKVLSRRLVSAVLPRLSATDFLFDVDLLATAQEQGFRLIEVPTIWIDKEGSNVRGGDAARMAASALRLYRRRRAGRRGG